MPEPNDAPLDTLLSAAFAALPIPTPSPTLQARVREQVRTEATRSVPLRIHTVEYRQENTRTRIVHRTAPNSESRNKTTVPAMEKHVTRLRTTLLVNRKGNP